MPKINVYLPDDLAEVVKQTGVPVSAICQRALEQSVKRVTAIRAAVVGDLGAGDPTVGLTQFTQRAKDVLKRSVENARERSAAEVGTRDLLRGLIEEGANLGLQVLRSLDVSPALVNGALGRLESAAEDGEPSRMSRTAANALELTVTEAIALGHNYVGCEHLLLGLLAEPDGAGGEVLRGLGVELRSARLAVQAALAGHQHQSTGQVARLVQQAVAKAMEPVLKRLERLEKR